MLSHTATSHGGVFRRQGVPQRDPAGRIGPRGTPLKRPRVLADTALAQEATSPGQGDAPVLVDQVLEKIKGTDAGISIAGATRAEVDGLLGQLEQIGKQQQPRPLDNALLWGNYNVAYTSAGPAERGQPAGGRFRGRIGRSLFQTQGLFQSVLEPDVATNKVEFKLFGLLPGFVGLRGKVVPVGEDKDTVKVLFESPVLSLANCITLRIGPPSSVQLSTTYLDERVRLGKGSRGSLFVFTRGGAADQAGMDQVGLQRTTPAGLAYLLGALGLMILGGWSLWSTGVVAAKVSAVGLWLVSGLVALVMRGGGIIRDDEDEAATRAGVAEAAAAPAASSGAAAAGGAT